jgi:probable rRNA maturation factor
VAVEIVNLQSSMRVPRAAIRRAVERVMREDLARTVRVSVAVVTDPRIAEMNREWLSHEGPTDVITFDLAGETGDAGDDVFGEIVISADRALDEARRRGTAPARELVLYAVHGMLHLSGYDDLSPADARRMHRREAEILPRIHGRPK